MIIYHGSADIVKVPKIINTEIGRDFGFGFYTTDIKEQAVRWAKRKALIAKKNSITSKSVRPILNIYEYDEVNANKELNIKKFDNPSLDWLEFIISCRGSINFKHEYDIVIGNIANDNVGETVSYVMNGIMRKEDAVERLKFEKINNQISFNTEKSLYYLKFIDSELL